MSAAVEPIRIAADAPVPDGMVALYALAGYWRPRSRKADAFVYALHADDLPFGGWTVQGYAREQVERVAVPVGSPHHTAALSNSRSRNAERADFAANAATFADVAHDDGGMVALYDLLEQHTALWASGMPVNTPRSEARRFMLACVDALAERMRHVAEGIIADDLALPWGECADGGEE